MTTNTPSANRITAIDLGTNSFHMVVTEIDSYGSLQIRDSYKNVVELGDEITKNRRIGEYQISKSIGILKTMLAINDQYKSPVKAVATHAFRQAVNYEEFLREIEAAISIKVEIISGPEEARLCFLGMRCCLPIDGSFTLGIDIGGGSTEIIIAKADEIKYVTSLNLGAAILTRMFFSDVIDAERINKLRAHIRGRLFPISKDIKEHGFETAVVCSGTAKTLSMIDSQLHFNKELTEVNGYNLKQENLDKIEKKLIDLSSGKEIRKAFDLEKNRSEIILAGAIILNSITKFLTVKNWQISSWGLREGLAIDSFSKQKSISLCRFKDIRWESILAFARKYKVDEHFAQHIVGLTSQIYDQIENHYFASASSDFLAQNRLYLKAASYLDEVGKYIGYPHYQNHSHYLVSQGALLGFSEEEKELIACIIKYSRKDIVTEKQSPHHDLHCNRQRINVLSSCLRIAKSLNRARNQSITKVSIDIKDHGLHLYFESEYPTDVEELILQKEVKYLTKALGVAFVHHKSMG